MKTLKNTIIISILLFFFASCLPQDANAPDSVVIITNNSTHNIIQTFQISTSADTSLLTHTYPLNEQNIPERTIKAGATLESNDIYLETLNEYPDNVIMVFLFHADSLKTNTWDEVVEKNLFLERHELTLDNVNNDEWLIIYE